MLRKDRYQYVLDYFRQEMPRVTTELEFGSAFQLLVATLLSAQCTDKRINMVTPALFAAYPTPADMAAASVDDIFSYIRSVSYPNNKARHLQGLAEKLVSDFGGEVPQTLEELTTLPGVGRKTANVIQAVAFKKAALAVDTHVFRVSHRLGLVPARCTTPYSVEMALRKYIPEAEVAASHYWILLHGRYTCTARNPKCQTCGLQAVCKEFAKRKG